MRSGGVSLSKAATAFDCVLESKKRTMDSDRPFLSLSIDRTYQSIKRYSFTMFLTFQSEILQSHLKRIVLQS